MMLFKSQQFYCWIAAAVSFGLTGLIEAVCGSQAIVDTVEKVVQQYMQQKALA